MTNILKDYFSALDRLVRGRPIHVPKGTRISNDSVSLEAGRKKGTIKKSRPIFSDLISAINLAAEAQSAPQDEMQERLLKAKADVRRYRVLWEEALAREVSLFYQLTNERQAWQAERAALIARKIKSISP